MHLPGGFCKSIAGRRVCSFVDYPAGHFTVWRLEMAKDLAAQCGRSGADDGLQIVVARGIQTEPRGVFLTAAPLACLCDST